MFKVTYIFFLLLSIGCSNRNIEVEKLKLEQEKLKIERKRHTASKVNSPKEVVNSPNKSNSAKISGDNIYLRSNHSIRSKSLGILTKGQRVQILNEHRPEGNENEAILRNTTYFYDSYNNEKLYTLEKGKAVVIEDFDGNQYSISYRDDKSGKKGYTQLSSSQVERISGEIWYYVSTNDGLRGWVFGKYLNKN